ncbi:MAG TPA: hypothetical protein VNK24_11940 [Elusimicrobiota bacterium]|nr:hypothetical protein [Elusimicrobiota bacterium]
MADNKTGRLTQSAAAFNYCLNLGGLSSGTQDNSFQTQQQKAEQAHQRYLALTAYNGALGNAMAGHGRQTSVSLGKGGSLNVWVVNGKPDLSSISILYRTPGECPGAGFCPFTSYTTWSQMSNQQQQQIEELLPYVNLGPKPSAPMPLAQLDSLTGSIIGSGQGTTALPPYPGLGPSSSGSNFQNRDGGLAIVGANAAGGGSGQGSSVDLNGGTPLPDRGGPIGQASSSSSSDSGPNYILPNGLPVITVGAPGSWVPIGNGMEKWMPQNPNDPLNNVYKYGTMISLGSGNDAWVPFHGGTPPQGLISNLGGAIQPSQLAALMEMYATGAVPSS